MRVSALLGVWGTAAANRDWGITEKRHPNGSVMETVPWGPDDDGATVLPFFIKLHKVCIIKAHQPLPNLMAFGTPCQRGCLDTDTLIMPKML